MPRSLLALQFPNITTDTGNKAKFKAIKSADPAANNEATITVPANTYYKVVSASLNLVQGITQTPQPALQVTDGTDVYWSQNGASAAQSASITSQYNWYPGGVLTAGAALTTNNAPMPDDLILAPGDVISTVTAGKGAATDLGKLVLRVVELKP